MRNTFYYSFVLICVGSFTQSCVTTSEPTSNKRSRNRLVTTQPTYSETAKAGGKSQPTNAAPGTDLAAEITKKPLKTKDLLGFITKHSLKAQGLDDADMEILSRLGPIPPREGSLGEATLALGLIKESLYGKPTIKNETTYEESNLVPQDGNHGEESSKTVTNNTASLESLCKEWDLKLDRALQQNPYLQSAVVYQMIHASLENPGNSSGFREQVTLSMTPNIGKFIDLATKMGILPTQQTPVAAESGSATPNGDPQTTASATPATPSMTELKADDAVLNEAQDLANRGLYFEAINKAVAIPKESPLYQASQEKIKTFSNNAVKDLRQKAAQAFQNALPETDSKVRTTYLVEAQKHLEEAINKYPNSDQLSTVRNNLDVINRNLDEMHKKEP